MSLVEQALRTINQGYDQCLAKQIDHYVCQLINDDQGFPPDVIDTVRELVAPMTFQTPVHISMLRAGEKPSTQYIFDGLEVIYCNSEQLEKTVAHIIKQRIKNKRGFG